MISDFLTVSWKMLLVRGIVGVIFGLAALIWPGETIIVLSIIWGIWALADGISSLFQSFDPSARGGRALLMVLAIIGILVGLVSILAPLFAAVALTWALGIWLIVRGIVEAISGFGAGTAAPRWLLLLSAAASIILGLLIVINPGAAAITLIILLGILAIIWGIVFIVLALMAQRGLKQADDIA